MNETLKAAIVTRANAYRTAIDKLRDAIENNPEAWDAANELREAVELVRCLGRLVDGRTVHELHESFGAPGDFGYESAVGSALDVTYRAPHAAANPLPLVWGKRGRAVSAAWRKGRVVRREIDLGDDAQIVQVLECRVNFDLDGVWTVTSQIVHEDDPSHSLTGRTTGLGRLHGLTAAKKIADKHVDELRKTWATENGAEW